MQLSANAYNTVKSLLPEAFLTACSQLKKKWMAIQRDRLQIEYLEQCLKKNVTPKHILEFIPKRHRSPLTFGEIHKKAITQERDNRKEAQGVHQSEFENEISRLSVTDKNTAKIIINHYAKREINKIKYKNRDQLNSLLISKEAKRLDKDIEIKPVVNLSTKKLSKGEFETLKLGFNMTWPAKLNSSNIKIELESLYDQITKTSGISPESLDDIQTNLKCHFADMQRSEQKPIPPKVKQHIKNLINLRNEKSIYVSRFDKGNGICIDVKEKYIYKMNKILADKTKFREFSIPKRVKGDPFIYAEERFNRVVKDLFKKEKLPKDILSKITSTGSLPARLYGLPKIHKNDKDPPYRPVLSMVNAYPSNLAKYLDSVLKPHIPNSRLVKDSFEFKDKLLSAHLPSSYHIVSYDVVSLFTNIPLEETINYILETVPQNEMPLPKSAMKVLLNLACCNILFSFQDNLYEQIDGMCMGSNLGPTMASFALDMLETKFNSLPIFYQRYVDDIFAVFHTKDDAESFLQHINSFHPGLKFTIEHSVNNSLTFLDVDVQVVDNVIETTWHKKKTNTGVYLPKNAYSPIHYKTAAMRSLIYRAYRLSSKNCHFIKSYNEVRLMFVNNGFHFKYIDKIKDKVIGKLKSNTSQITNEEKDKEKEITKIYYKLPYVKSLEAKNKNLFSKINSHLVGKAEVRLAYNTNKTSSFFPNKDKVTESARSHIVYQYTCGHCGGCYTGETTRHFTTRLHEHLEGRPTPTEVTKHHHIPTVDSFKIVHHTPHTKIGEALYFKLVDEEKKLNANRPPFQLRLF